MKQTTIPLALGVLALVPWFVSPANSEPDADEEGQAEYDLRDKPALAQAVNESDSPTEMEATGGCCRADGDCRTLTPSECLAWLDAVPLVHDTAPAAPESYVPTEPAGYFEQHPERHERIRLGNCVVEHYERGEDMPMRGDAFNCEVEYTSGPHEGESGRLYLKGVTHSHGAVTWSPTDFQECTAIIIQREFSGHRIAGYVDCGGGQ